MAQVDDQGAFAGGGGWRGVRGDKAANRMGVHMRVRETAGPRRGGGLLTLVARPRRSCSGAGAPASITSARSGPRDRRAFAR